MKKNLSKIISLIIIVVLLLPAIPAAASSLALPNLIYSAHVQDIGWMPNVAEDQVAGTTGRGKNLESLTINVGNTTLSGQVQYRAHVEDIGWQDYRANGAIAGTTGKSKAIQAIQIRLTGELEQHFDVYYQVHVAHLGWMGWAKNGEIAGTTGLGINAQAYVVKLVAKGATAPVSNQKVQLSGANLSYRTHQSNVGWSNYVGSGTISGLTGRSYALEALQASVSGSAMSGGIQVEAHAAGKGWLGYSDNNVIAGTAGENRQLEAVRMRLTDEIADVYDIYYRAHVQNFGWLDWAKNGEVAGSTGIGHRMEAIEIRLVNKFTGKAPGAISRPSVSKGMYNWPVAWGHTFVDVDLATQTLRYVENGILRIETPIVTGKPSTPTPRGTYTILSKERNRVLRGADYASFVSYWMPFTRQGHGIHDSSWQSAYGGNRYVSGFGSHGCVNTPINQVSALYNMIKVGTKVIVH